VNGENVEKEDCSRAAEMIRAGGQKLDIRVTNNSDDSRTRHTGTVAEDQLFEDIVVCPKADGRYFTVLI